MDECTIYFIRHGEILSNKEDVYAGWSDEELTPEGEQSARRMGEKLSEVGIEALFSSPIRRAVQTAELINLDLGKELITEPGFKEIKMGPWEGLRIKDIEGLFPEEFELWMTRPGDLVIEGRDTLGELQARAVAGVEKVIMKAVGKVKEKGKVKETGTSVVLVVTHVAIIRVLFLYYNGRPLNDYKKINVPNLSVFKLTLSKKAASFTPIEL